MTNYVILIKISIQYNEDDVGYCIDDSGPFAADSVKETH